MNGKPEGEVIALDVEPAREPPPAPTPFSRMHGAAITAMTVCAFVGIVAMLAFITVRWPGSLGRYVIGVLIIAVLGFLTSALIAVSSAMRDSVRK